MEQDAIELFERLVRWGHGHPGGFIEALGNGLAYDVLTFLALNGRDEWLIDHADYWYDEWHSPKLSRAMEERFVALDIELP